MRYYIDYVAMTKEHIAIPMSETFEDRDTANKRWLELKKSGFCFEIKTKTEEPTRRVIQAAYTPRGKEFTFEVNFSVKKKQALWDNIMQCYVRAVTDDHYEKESRITERFPLNRLRSAYDE